MFKANISLIVLLCLINIVCAIWKVPEDALLTIPEIINKYGYPVEKHWVTTPDGYILGVFRIPHGRNVIETDYKRKPILLVHGVAQSADAFILNGPRRALAYALAESNYDVWMLNVRGTTYSLNHTNLEPNPAFGPFWNYTFYEIGMYDVPSTIDYILQVTNSKKLFYTGYSQGGVSFFIMCSELPSYNEKVEAFIGLAPASYFGFPRVPLTNTIQTIYRHVKPEVFKDIAFNIVPSGNFRKLLQQLLWLYCVDGKITQELCWVPINMGLGFNRREANSRLLPILFGHVPTGISFKQSAYFYQFAKYKHFAKFDYGREDNLRMYNSTTPPSFNISNINVPIHIFYSRGDDVVLAKDVLRFAKQLRSLKQLIQVRDLNWAHLDFVYGKSTRHVINEPLINILNQYRKNNV